MNNEELLTAFADYLDTLPSPPDNRAGSLAILCEFAATIDPSPLAEATLEEIKIFQRDHKAPAVPMRPLPLTQREVETRYLGIHSELRYAQVRLVMLYFRHFLKSLSRSRKNRQARERLPATSAQKK